jgi:hypothetical protein
VGKDLIELGGELKARIHRGHQRTPLGSNFRTNVTIERSVDLAAIEILREIFERMNLLLLKLLGIDNIFPVFVGKAGGAHQNFMLRGHDFTLAQVRAIFPREG